MRGGERGVVQLSLAVSRREARGEQQVVALPERDVQPVGKMKHHVARGSRTTAFDKTQMALRYLGLAGEVELAQAPPDTPLAQQRTGEILSHQHAPG